MRTPHLPVIHFHTGAQHASVPWFNPRRAWDAVLRLGHSPWLRIGPRASLLSGSVFVLLSLFVPVAFNACGANRTGREFLLGEGIWPGMASFVQTDIERGVYALGVALAGFTVLLLLISLRRPVVLEKGWIRWPFLLTGLVCLFAIVDFVVFNLGDPVSELLTGLSGLDKPETVIPFLDSIAILLMAVCLRSKFLRSQLWVLLLFGAGAAVCLLAMALSFLELFQMPNLVSMDAAVVLAASPGILYWVVPMGLWIRFGFSHSNERRVQWQKLRPKIMLLYIPAGVIAGGLFLLPSAWPLWGVAPYLAGLSLIFLGYTELVHMETPFGKEGT